MKNENEFLKIEDYLGPRKISINNMAINLLSTPIDRAHQTFELQDFENALLEKMTSIGNPIALSSHMTKKLTKLRSLPICI